MPFRTIWEEKGIKWEFHGHVTSEEIEEANRIFFRDPRSKTSEYQLVLALETVSVDWSPIEMVDITFNDVAASKSGLQLKIAYIAIDEGVREKIEKYIAMSRNLNSNWEFRGFESEQHARKWLNGEPE